MTDVILSSGCFPQGRAFASLMIVDCGTSSVAPSLTPVTDTLVWRMDTWPLAPSHLPGVWLKGLGVVYWLQASPASTLNAPAMPRIPYKSLSPLSHGSSQSFMMVNLKGMPTLIKKLYTNHSSFHSLGVLPFLKKVEFVNIREVLIDGMDLENTPRFGEWYLYRLVSPHPPPIQVHILKPNPQSNGLWRWGLWRWSRALMNGVGALKRETPESSFTAAVKDTAKSSLWTRKWVLTRPWIRWHLDLGFPSLLNCEK